MVVITIMACLLILSLSKWVIYKLSFMSVLMYYGEREMELPTKDIIQEYQLKVVRKMLGINAD